MKIRLNYVSNSSSSSYIIVYDKNFYGDLSKFFKEAYLGCESSVMNKDKFYKYFYDNDENKIAEIEDKIKNNMIDENEDILFLKLDNEYQCIIDLLWKMNLNNESNKMIFIEKDDK